MERSRYFAAAPPAPPAVLTALRSRKRKQRETDAKEKPDGVAAPQLSEMEKQVVRLRRTHPDTLLLFECGYRMRIFAEDAENAAAVLGIRAQRHRCFLEASVPVHRTMFHARRLVNAGFKVGVVKQVDSAATRANSKAPGARSKPLERCVTDIYTRATIPEIEGSGDDSDEEEACTRFICCVVEETVHSKPFFTQSMHDADKETKRSQAFSEEVRIGIFVHDVHNGETRFDEFEDDGKRQRLQRTLETLNPVEFVLPAGKLSAYTEQLLENFTATSAARTSVSFMENAVIPCIRVERIPNECFECSLARETFSRVFCDAEAEYSGVVAHPSLPKLCMSCFGGMWNYLSSLGVAKSLVAPSYSATATIVGQFHLPPETHQDLDLFVNSTTKRGVGSLLSILNHTKTSAGTRKLREWIHTPLNSLSDIRQRQITIESLAFPPGSLSGVSLPHRIAYEDLTATILPRSKHLLKYLQQIHLGKATPSQAVGALQMLQDLEGHVNALKAMFEDSSNEGQSNLVDRLIGSYPVLNARLADLLEEIDVRSARRNDIENTIQRRIRRNPSKARKYCEFTQELETLERQYDAILVCCKGIFNNSSLEYVTFRGGSLNDIHHLIEVKRKNLYEVPQDWLVVNSTKKVVRFHPKEIVQLHVQEEFLMEQKDQLVRSTWRQFVREVDAQVYVMGMQCVSILAKLDALCSLATVAQSYSNYTLPEFVDDGSAQLEIIEGRHPVIETLLKGSSYISNSVTMVSNAGSPGSLLAISGPNMGGKTSLLRMCALVVILAQMGSFVPAASARLTVFDGVYTLMHRAPLRLHGSSACASELTALGSISRNATQRSLVLIDEVGIGMTAHEAEALAVAQMVYFVNTIGCHVVFATHLAVATKRLQTRLGSKCCTKQLDYHFYDQDGEDTMKYANAEVDEQVTFHYVLRDGIANDSFAFETAKRAGIAPGILERARNLQV